MPPLAAVLPEAAKTVQPGLRPVGNAPLWVLRTTSPGGGSLFPASLSANLCHSFYSAARISPSGGDAAKGGRRGAFPSRHRPGWHVFPPPTRAVVKVLSYWRPFFLKGAHHNPRTEGASNFRTLGAEAPSNLRTLTPKGRVHKATPHKNTAPGAMLFFYNICLIMRYTRAPTAAVQGMVIIQADTIW